MARAKRGRGEGGVYQRESDGLWVGTISLGYDGTGKRKRKVVYGQSKKEVLDKLRELQNSAASGRLPDGGNITVGGFIRTWLDGIKASVEPTTWAGYDGHFRNHLRPRIGGVKLAGLTAVHISHLYTELLNDGVSASTTRKVGTTLRSALERAVEMRVIAFNPATAVAKPKAEPKEVHVFTPGQVGNFLAEAAKDRLEAVYVAAVDSGCRQGELFALRWTDLDPAAGTVTITKSLAELNGRLWVKDVKTKKGRRRIQLSLSLGVLAEHRERMRVEGQDVTRGLVFCDTEGKPLRKSNFWRRSFVPILKRAGLPADTRFHDLRHCCASLLLIAGTDAKVVSERLGHGSAAFTMNTYQHVLPGLQQAAADRLRDLLAVKPEVVIASHATETATDREPKPETTSAA
jgi:integrase